MSYREIIDKTGANVCIECGKCTGTCPLARVNPTYSPRLMVERALMGFEDEIARDWDLWSCLTCGVCASKCPSEVAFTEFILNARKEAVSLGYKGAPSHDGILQHLMAIQSMDGRGPESRFKRNAWASVGRSTEDKGEVYYFAGCLPLYEIMFADYGAKPLSIATDALLILNKLGIEPVISPEERCCGHDLLWNGDEARFVALAKKNVAVITASGAKTVVFTCPEGYWTFKKHVPDHLGPQPFEVKHITELLAGKGPDLTWGAPSTEGVITYHDPCRLGRFAGQYDAPRAVLAHIPGVTLKEMDHHHTEALCCGTSGWINCTTSSRRIRTHRLEEARNVGASTLVTGCAKCQIHFRCTLRSKGVDTALEIKDIVNLAAESLGVRNG